MKIRIIFAFITFSVLHSVVDAFASSFYSINVCRQTFHSTNTKQISTCYSSRPQFSENERSKEDLKAYKKSTKYARKKFIQFCTTDRTCDNQNVMSQLRKGFISTLIAFTLSFSSILPTPLTIVEPSLASDGAAIASCLLKKCPLPLTKCILNPKCLANVICINTCNGKSDETGCQIQCGNLFENDVVGEFNKCALTEMDCVPQRKDDGSYPIPPNDVVVKKFDTKLWNGKWYITAGQNELFDTFPCQVHFFTETSPGTFFGKITWRIEEPDGEYFTRDALQRFVQDPNQPGHLINHNNEYLHYEDDWYVIDYAYDDNEDGVPPFAFIYYRGQNDAWVGYGGAVVYTRDSKLPAELLPRLRTAAQKVNFNFDKDFTLTDNSCKTLSEGEQLLLKEKFAGKMALQTEQQLQAAAVRLRNASVNTIKAQELFLSDELGQAQKAVEELTLKANQFEKEIIQDVNIIEKVISDEVVSIKEIEQEVVRDIDLIKEEVITIEMDVVRKAAEVLPIVKK